ncbi:TlpA family protein disulfide reductase [bacterium]|nr:TlpA family protein disulfide reductase [bacterium]
MHEKFSNDHFQVLGVSVDRAEMGKIRDYVKRMGITFPNLHDATSETATIYQVTGVPMTFIIDARGRALGVAVGLRPWMSDDSQKLVQQLIAETKAK